VRWYFGLVGAVGASIVAILFICLGLFLPRGAMSGFDPVGFLGYIFIWVTAFAVVPGLLVTRFYRRKNMVMQNMWPNNAQRTAACHRSCNRRASWAPSLNLGR